MNHENTMSVDLVMDDDLMARGEMYAQQHAISVEALLVQGVAAFLKASDAGDSESSEPTEDQSHPPTINPKALSIGSLSWQLEKLGVGESLLKPRATETLRRTCIRAIANVLKRQPDREYDLDLWLALHHSGTGQSMRLYKIERVR